MTLTSTLGSPGIEIREIDNSVRINSSTSTTIYVPGFASQGPVEEVMSIGSISDFETIYGVPTNSAERYFYYTVKSILDGNGAGTNVLCSRIPYGKDAGDTVSTAYTMLAYPAIPIKKIKGSKDFDQYIFDDDSLTNIKELLKVEKNTPEIEEITLSIDDDYLKDISTLNITSIETGKIIPSVTATYYNKDGEINTEISAPEITLSNDLTANGQIAIEQPNNTNVIHFSYTIMKDSTQVGSFYIKAVYKTSDSLVEKEIPGGTSSITATFTDVFEIADDYTDGEEITYIVGSPVTYQVSISDYYKIITGELLKWQKTPYDFSDTCQDDTQKFGHFDAIGHAAFIVLNTSRSIINNNFEGFYLGITDNTFVSPSEDYVYDAIQNVKVTTTCYDEEENGKMGLIDTVDGAGDFQTISTNRLSFHLANNYQGSLSQVISRNITSMDISGTDYDDTINMALFKLNKSTDSNDILKLNYTIREKYNWSFDKSRLKSVSGSSRPVSAFVENVVENSKNLNVLMNPYIANKTFVDLDGNIKGKIRVFGDKLLKNLELYEKKYLCYNTSN